MSSEFSACSITVAFGEMSWNVFISGESCCTLVVQSIMGNEPSGLSLLDPDLGALMLSIENTPSSFKRHHTRTKLGVGTYRGPSFVASVLRPLALCTSKSRTLLLAFSAFALLANAD